MGKYDTLDNVDTRIHKFLAKKQSNKLSDDVAKWFYGKFGDRRASVQDHEPVTWAQYER